MNSNDNTDDYGSVLFVVIGIIVVIAALLGGMYLLINYFYYTVAAAGIIYMVARFIYHYRTEMKQQDENLKLLEKAKKGDIRAMEALSNHTNQCISFTEALQWKNIAKEISEQREIKRKKKELESKQKYKAAQTKYKEIVESKLNKEK
ncbi:MAG: hypothetical protein K2H47_01200 [Muribaculaceae bacterium]|nr:hypothetical protein [Muribaculaceae bacterium]